MRLASLGQIKFLNLMGLSKKLQKLKVFSKDHPSSRSEGPKKRGRPVKRPEDDLSQNLESGAENLHESHDCQFAINFIDTTASEKMHADNEEFKSLLGKRNIEISPFDDEEAKLNSELVKTSLNIIIGLKARIESTINAESKSSGQIEHSLKVTTFKKFSQEVLHEYVYEDSFNPVDDSSFLQESQSSELSSQIDFESTPIVDYLWEEDRDMDLFDQEDEEQEPNHDFVQKRLKTHAFVGEEEFGTFSSIGKKYANSSARAFSSLINCKTSSELNFEFKIDANTTPSKFEKNTSSSRGPNFDIEKITSFAQTESRIMKDVSTNNVCEMIDFGNDKPSVNGDTSDDMDFRENSFLSPSQSPKHKSSGKSLEDMFFNHMSIQTSPLYQTLVGDKYTQVDI